MRDPSVYKTELEIPPFGLSGVKVNYYYTKGTLGNRRGHPDTWTPDEADELEVVSVEVNTDDVWIPLNYTLLPESIQAEIEQEILQGIEEEAKYNVEDEGDY